MRIIRLVLASVSLLMLVSMAPAAAPTTEWSQTFPSDELSQLVDVIQTEDAGYALFGSAKDADGISQLRIIKLDRGGRVDWVYTSTEEQDVVASAGLLTHDHGYYIAGDLSHPSLQKTSVIVQKVSATGELAWANGYGAGENWNLQGSLIHETSDNSFMLFDTAVGEESNMLHVIATRPGGTTISLVDCPSLGRAVATDILRLGNGSFILAASTTATDSTEAAGWLVKVQNGVDCAWVRQIWGPGAQGATALVEEDNGRIIVCGIANPIETFSQDIYLAKLNDEGARHWYRTYGGEGADYAAELVLTQDGGVVLVGSTSDYGGRSGILILRTGVGGEVLWTKILGESKDSGVSIHQTADGGWIIGANCGDEGYGCGGVRIIKLSPDKP